MTEPAAVTMRALLERYDGILLDVYGVLTDARGALPGARELIGELARQGKPYAIVTNDASRSQATYVRRFAGFGLEVAADRVVTSGSLLPGYLRERGLAGARCAVLGTQDSVDYVRAGGGEVVPIAAGMELDVLVVADDEGYDFLPGVEHALSAVVRAIEAGRSPELVLPNPDLVYPKGAGELGLTAGAVALLIEAGLARRFPGRGLAFARLGKPAPHLFAQAARLLGLVPSRVVMVGDQLETDVAGAHAAGVPAALLAGISRWDDARATATLAPRYLLDTIAP
jgi:4-nitrophenyl phosphatase